MRIVVSGGGSGGHIAPIAATLDKLAQYDKNNQFCYIGTSLSMEKKILAGLGVEYATIPAGKFRRYGRGVLAEAMDLKTSWHNFRDLFKFIGGLSKSYSILRKYKPDAVFLKGGYVGLPVGLAANRLKIPIILHESDVVLGLSNKTLSKKAVAIGVGFPVEAYKDYKLDNLHFVGCPLRENVLVGNREDAKKAFNVKENKPNILIFGSSRGSTPINKVVFDSLDLLAKKYNIIHVTGEEDIERARFLLARLDETVKRSYMPYSFLSEQMGLAYALCDVAVSRAGATSLAELAVWKKPSIIIPRPGATGDHQNANATFLSRQGAIRVLPQKDLTGIRLLSEIERLIDNQDDREYLSSHIGKVARPKAAGDMARLIYNVVEEQRLR